MATAYVQDKANPEGCKRQHERTSLLVIASLLANGVSNRIKVRNLSASGAMIEGASLPREGARIDLRRGAVSLPGRVVWSTGGRAGLEFHGYATAEDWLPNTNPDQRKVDAAAELARQERAVGLATRAAAQLPTSARSAAEIAEIANLLDDLADDLAGDPVVIVRYLSKLQVLDVAGQALRATANLMAAGPD